MRPTTASPLSSRGDRAEERITTMVKDSMDPLGPLRKREVDGDIDLRRQAVRVLMETTVDAEVSARTGAECGERNPDRLTHRRGCRSRSWDTRVATVEVHIPRLREGSSFPSPLEPRRRGDRGLPAVTQQAHVEGVATGRLDDPV